MELKGSNDWSDLDSSEEEEVRAGKETAQPQPERDAVPERRAPFFDLGLIYSREPEAAPLIQKQIFQERDRSAPETAQGVTLGSPESASIAQPMMPPEVMMAHEGIEDRDEDEEDEKSEEKGDQKSSSTQPVRVPLAPGIPLRVRNALPPANTEQAKTTAPSELGQEAPQGEFEPFTTESTQGRLPDAEQRDYAVSFVPPAAETYQADNTPPVGVGPGNRNRPPLPPEQTPPSYGEPTGWGGHEGNVYGQQVKYSMGSQPNMAGYVTRRRFESAQEDLRRKMAARMIVVALLSWYLGHRPVKPLREQVDKLQDTTQQQTEQLNRFTYQQQETQARIAEQNRQIEQFTRPQSVPFGPERPAVRPIETLPVLVGNQPKIIGENGQEIILQPGQRVERIGAYDVIVDEHNRVLQRVMVRGEEYKRDLSHEQMPTPFSAQGSRLMPTGLSGSGSAGQPMAGSSGSPILPNVQLPVDHTLPSAFDPSQQRPLQTPKQNSIVAAVTSPWLWLGVGVLLIAFFAAATI